MAIPDVDLPGRDVRRPVVVCHRRRWSTPWRCTGRRSYSRKGTPGDGGVVTIW